jgi:hypothetical protein
VWAYVLILIIGVAVTIAGVRLGRRRREDPFANVATPDDATTSEPAPFTSHREPAPLGAAEAETAGSPATVAGPRAPRATLEERLREARDARAADAADGGTRAATSEAATAVEQQVPAAEGGEDATAALTVETQAATERPAPPATPAAGSADADAIRRTASTVEADAVDEPATEPAPPAPAPTKERVVEAVTQRALAPEVRDDFAQRWTPIRMRLVTRPSAAVADADAFVRELLEARGLPNDPDDPAMAEASNAYPDVVDPFRLATAIARRAEEGTADAEQLRLATVHYRDAVERLLEVGDLPVA